MENLWEHQKEGVRRALENNGCFGFFFEMGAGKTFTTIYTCRQLFNKHARVLTTLVVAPLVTLHNWRNEWLKFSTLKEHQLVVLKGTGEAKTKQLYGIREPSVIITNYESLCNEKIGKALRTLNIEVLICDESQRIKNPNAHRTKHMHSLSKIARYRFILSGTPILKNTMDVWSQFFLLDHGKVFGDSFYKFKLHYFFDKNAGMPKHTHFPDWQPRPECREKLERLLATRTMSVKKSECLDLPTFVRQKVYVELDGPQKKHYLQMKELFITYLEDTACVATIALTKGLRMLQILSGHMPMDNGEIISFAETSREAALQELLEDLTPNHKVIIWAVFKKDFEVIAKLCRKMPVEYRELHGSIPMKERMEGIEAFNNQKSVRVLIAHPVSAGLGINLVAASYSIYYSRNFSLENDLQSEARNYRAGSEVHEKITRIDIVAKDTLDEEVLKALQAKKEIGEATLRAWAAK